MATIGSFEISRPSKRITPESIGCAPTMELNKVVLPEPLGPISPTMARSSTEIDMPRLAITPPKDLETFSTSRSGMASSRPGIWQHLAAGGGVGLPAVEPADDPLRKENDDNHDQQAERNP